MDLKKKKIEIEKRFDSINKAISELKKQLQSLEVEKITLSGQFSLISEIEKEDKK